MSARLDHSAASLRDNAVSRPHELHDEFPHDAPVLHLLKLADTHFCNLAERYHALNRAIHRIEIEVESASDMYLTRLRKQRLSLLDEIAAIIEDAELRFAPGLAASDDQPHHKRARKRRHQGTDPVRDQSPPAHCAHTPTPPAAGILFGRRSAKTVPA